MKTLKPEYLLCQENGSNKFYIVVDLDNGGDCLIGFGPATSGTLGSWSKRDSVYGKKKLAEKRRKYRPSTQHGMPHSIQREMLNQIISALGCSARLNADGTVTVDSPSAPPTPPKPAPPPKRVSKDQRINIWL